MIKPLNLDTEAIYNKVIPIINRCYNYLAEAQQMSSSINVPSDFIYYKELKSMTTEISESKEKIEAIKQNILNIAEIFDETELENRRIMNDILKTPSLRPETADRTHTYNNIPKAVNTDFITYEPKRAADKIIDAARRVHFKQLDWRYYTDNGDKGGLIYYDIERTINNPFKETCCATYVAEVVYEAGFFTEEQLNEEKYNYNYPVALNNLFKDAEWEVILDASELKPGDIVFMSDTVEINEGPGTVPDHVQIYAGDNKWYDAGNTKAIQTKKTIKDADWEKKWANWWAFRAPEENNEPKANV